MLSQKSCFVSELVHSVVSEIGLKLQKSRMITDGYILTTALMRWFWDHYADPADRGDPRAAPLRGDLEGLPPACIVAADFDPLRDEDVAYARALEAAGVPVRLARARGHTHTSVTMVGVVISGAPVRAEIGEALRDFFPSPNQAHVS